jgi:hypothetical protein
MGSRARTSSGACVGTTGSDDILNQRRIRGRADMGSATRQHGRPRAKRKNLLLLRWLRRAGSSPTGRANSGGASSRRSCGGHGPGCARLTPEWRASCPTPTPSVRSSGDSHRARAPWCGRRAGRRPAHASGGVLRTLARPDVSGRPATGGGVGVIHARVAVAPHATLHEMSQAGRSAVVFENVDATRG